MGRSIFDDRRFGLPVRRISLWVLGLLSITTLAMAAESPNATKVVDLPYGAGKLTLWREAIPSPGDAAVLSYFQRHQNETAIPNTALYLALSGNDSSTGRVVWYAYVYQNNITLPREALMADIAKPVNGDKAYLALARSISWDVKISLWQVDLNANLGSYPAQPDLNVIEHARSLPPLTSYSARLVGRDIAGLSEIHADQRSGLIVVTGKRESAGLPDAIFQFNLLRNNWSAEYDAGTKEQNAANNAAPQEIKQP